MTPASYTSNSTRRSFLRGTAGTCGAALCLSAAAGADQARQWVVVPRIDAVEEYRAQILFIGHPDESDGENLPRRVEPSTLPDDDPGDVPIGQCEFEASWSSGQTEELNAVFVHRHGQEPIAFDISIYVDGEESSLEEGQQYITNEVVECSEDYVATPVEFIPEGEAPDYDPEDADDPDNGQVPDTPGNESSPEVTEGVETPGFGVLAAGAGAAGLLALRRLLDRRSD